MCVTAERHLRIWHLNKEHNQNDIGGSVVCDCCIMWFVLVQWKGFINAIAVVVDL